jgi:hypothetical protein
MASSFYIFPVKCVALQHLLVPSLTLRAAREGVPLRHAVPGSTSCFREGHSYHQANFVLHVEAGVYIL